MPPSSLKQTATSACIKQIRYIEDVGDCPYSLLRPVLSKITNVDQLRRIEENSPQIAGQDTEIWLKLIKRDAPNFDPEIHTPSNPASWWKVHRKLTQETRAKAEEMTKRLSAQLDRKRQERANTTVEMLDRVVAPRKAARSAARNGPTRLTAGQAMLKAAKKTIHDHKKFNRPVAPTITTKPSNWVSTRLGKVSPVTKGVANKLSSAPSTPSFSKPSIDFATQSTPSDPPDIHASLSATTSSPQPRRKLPSQSVFMPTKRRRVG